jgi:hypothetical protein
VDLRPSAQGSVPSPAGVPHIFPDVAGQNLSIAGVQFSVRSVLPLRSPVDDCYRPFLIVDGAASSTIDVTVTEGAFASTPSNMLFDSDGSWSIESWGEGGYQLNLGKLSDGGAAATARADAETRCVEMGVNVALYPAGDASDGVTSPLQYPLDELLLMNHLATRGGVIVHAAGAVVNGEALVFPGVSEAGKSTISKLFGDAGLGHVLLSDDRVVVRYAANGTSFESWGTPWPGDARAARNASAPLKALLFLVQADTDRVVRLTSGEAMRRLMPVAGCPWYDGMRATLILDTCGRLVESVPCYDLYFRRGPAVIELLVNGRWS